MIAIIKTSKFNLKLILSKVILTWYGCLSVKYVRVISFKSSMYLSIGKLRSNKKKFFCSLHQKSDGKNFNFFSGKKLKCGVEVLEKNIFYFGIITIRTATAELFKYILACIFCLASSAFKIISLIILLFLWNEVDDDLDVQFLRTYLSK